MCFFNIFDIYLAIQNVPRVLYFGVKFYAADPCALKEEVTRYLFFLQLKKDVLNGKLTCSIKKAAEISALALQCKFKAFVVEYLIKLFDCKL